MKNHTVYKSSPEEEGEAETTHCNPHSLSPCTTGSKECRKIMSEFEPRKKGGVEEGVLRFVLFHFTFIQLVKNEINFQVLRLFCL